ncbi:G-protein coupled receptor GRL101-like [Patiria miniata]|uniref:G-protein coupled receptors family 1 profile domain-containing protein n=1 Tax=Patiria miniata TaxID=46514 RepID=A0A914B3X7_PATMI|nr:G-protein coupled receptor GRL101-like [Patiria miniata]
MCLQPYAYCDGVWDCIYGEDEQNCVNVTCGMEQYLCQGRQRCIPYESICDGTVDCIPFRDDEENCEYHGRPAGCESLMVGELLYVECKHGWNASTVGNLVQITHSLELSGGSVPILEGGLFKRLGMLRKLSLRNNNISRIELNAFTELKNMTSLDISENNIQELPGDIFRELTMLLELAIRSVPVQFIRANAFAGLTHLQKLVLMRGNGTANAISSSLYDRATEVEDRALSDLLSLQKVYVDDHRLCCDFRSVLPDDNQCINIQLQSPLFNCGRLMPNTVLQVFMWILGCSALIGNLLVIAWRIREDSGKGSKYVHSFLVLNLAMSDLLMGVYMVIIATVDVIKKEEYYLTATEWRKSALCKAAGVISVMSSEASVFFITLISVDRYLCIVHPFSRVRLRERSVWVSTASIWIASLVASLVPTLLVTGDSDIYGLSDVCIGLPLLTRPDSYTFTEADVGSSLGNDTYLIPRPVGSRPTWSYSIVLFLGINFLCLLTIAVCYASIFVKVKRSIRRVRQHSHRDEEIKMASKMAVIVGSDCLCWMPVIILGILSQTSAIRIQPDVYAWLVVFVLPINSSLNPYLYTIVTAVSRRRQANWSSSRRSSHKPEKTLNNDVPMERRADSGCWTITTPTATPTATPTTTPTSSIYRGNFEHM